MPWQKKEIGLSATRPLTSQKPVPDLTILPGGPSADSARASSAPENWIEDYLDHLCAPLIGVVPYEERQLLRGEAAFHIEHLANEFRLLGQSDADAVRAAIRKYGKSDQASDVFLEAWFRRQRRSWFLRRFGLANGYAMIYFGIVAALSNALVQIHAFFPDTHPFEFAGLTPAQMRRLIPEPLPLPEADPLLLTLIGVALVAPFIAGWLTGTSVLVRPTAAVWRVQAMLTLGAFVLGSLMLPQTEGIILAFIELLWWLPVGGLTAWVAALFTSRQRCRYDPSRLL